MEQSTQPDETNTEVQNSPIVFKINMDGNMIYVREWDISTAGRKIENSPVTSGTMNANSVKTLAEYYGLLEETVTNPQLFFLGGDINYWAEHGRNWQHLNKQFAAREVILNVTERDNIVIVDQGKLSWTAEQLVNNNIL